MKGRERDCKRKYGWFSFPKGRRFGCWITDEEDLVGS